MASVPSFHATDVEGGRPVQRRYAIVGRLRTGEYLAFVAERAAWFGISGWVGADADGVTLVAAGPEAMVGALEMACALGPLTALIETIGYVEEPGAVDLGFAVRT